ncbi:MAG: 2-oxoacid:acceptor oxidoreductase subunit alpha, partial [Bdellovibrionales bacterium]|nr:2-oxoacid:acceptor oxidoreductase subunit alpha [Bdellovibrionales bacterium]
MLILLVNMTKNKLTLNVATINGSGSQSSNSVLVKSLFRMGLPVGGKNMFPSNIAGLPTWYTIRVNPHGYTGRLSQNDIVVAMNTTTLIDDQKSLKPNGCLIYNSDLKIADSLFRKDIQCFGIPFRKLVAPLSESVKLRKFLTNMVYAGIVSELIDIPYDIIESVITDAFQDKPAVIESNIEAIKAGRDYAKQNLDPQKFPYKVEILSGGNENKILIDGNSATAMGLLHAGCTFAAWYPITPSSSVIERFENYAKKYRKDTDGRSTYAIIQAEDELSSICMTIGAGWTGARAMTATSGPGLSLMAEAAGLSYFAEIPAVIWDVQRVGPSTGLPTRTMQGDLLSAYTLSHGDTKHVVLLPANPKECFEMATTAFDLAEHLQTLVIVLSDLDIGMNQYIVDRFQVSQQKLDRGKILNKDALEKVQEFARYKDVDGDGIGYRTLPGTEHPKAAYFTRGTGHNETAKYSENNFEFRANMERLLKKLETAKTLVPAPEITLHKESKVGVLYYGSSQEALLEAFEELNSDRKTP